MITIDNIIKDKTAQCNKNCRFGIFEIVLVLMMLMTELFLVFLAEVGRKNFH